MAKNRKHGRQILAVFLAVIMSLSLLQVSAFADSSSASGVTPVSDSQIQKDTAGNVLYYSSNSSGNFSATGSKDPIVSNKNTNPNVIISKTIQGTDTYNTFDITLDVQTTQQVSTTTLKQGAAVSLVLDTSRSMQWDASGGGYCLKGLDTEAGLSSTENEIPYTTDADASGAYRSGDVTFAGAAAQELIDQYNSTHNTSYILDGTEDQKSAPMRITTITTAMCDFLDSYASSGSADAPRLVSLSEFNGNTKLCGFDGSTEGWLDVSDSTNLGEIKTYLQDQFTPAKVADWDNSTQVLASGTHIGDGLSLGKTQLTNLDTSGIDISNVGPRCVILLTDGEKNGGSDPDTVADRIVNTDHYNLYVIGFMTTCSWLTDGNYTAYKEAQNADEIAAQFDDIITTLTLLANAWNVTDPMGDHINYVTDSAAVSTGTDSGSVSFDQGKIIWDLTKVTPEETQSTVGESSVTLYHYALTYQVHLDAMEAPNEYQLTNGQTTLSYWLTNEDGAFLDTSGNQIANEYQNPEDALLTLDFKVPKVKPALTSYTVTKVWTGTGDTEATRPGSIFVQLYSRAEVLGGSVQLTAPNWTYTWNNLPAELAGNFRVDEVTSLDNYTPCDPTYQSLDNLDLTYETNKITPNNHSSWDLDSYIPTGEGTDGCDVAFIKLANNSGSKIKFAIWTKDPVSLTIQQTLVDKMNNIAGFDNASFEKTVFFSGSETLTSSGGTTTIEKTSDATNVVFNPTCVWTYFACGTYTYTPAGATITNQYTPGSITITKDVTGDLPESDVAAHAFTFSIADSSGTVIDTIKLPSVAKSTDPSNWTTTVSNLPFGTYTVTETSGSVDGYRWTDSAGNDITSNPQQSVALTPAANETPAVTSGSVTFVNHYSLGAPQNTADFSVHKVDASDTNTGLNGAVFTLYSTRTGDESTGYTYSDSDAIGTFTTATAESVNGMATITIPATYLDEASNGIATCYLKETTAPDGYLANDTVWVVTLNKSNGNVTLSKPATDIHGLFYQISHWFVSFTSEEGWNSDTNTLTVSDTRKTDSATTPAQIKVLKTDENSKAIKGTDAATQATFTLTAPDSSKANKKTNTNGVATFKITTAGIYTLTEKDAPDAYTKSSDTWYVNVTEGTPTSDWSGEGSSRVYLTTTPLIATIYTDDGCTQPAVLKNGKLPVENDRITAPVEMTKTWVGGVGSSITVQLQAGPNDCGAPVTLAADTSGVTVGTNGNGNTTWSYSFGDLPKYNPGGSLISYSVVEIAAPTHYSTSGSGLTITNTYNPSNTTDTITGQKLWSDQDNRDGIRPESIRVALYVNDGTTAVTYQDIASGTFALQYTYDANMTPPTYEVKEIGYTDATTGYHAFSDDLTTVPGYTISGSGTAENHYVITNTHEPEVISSIPVVKTWSGSTGNNIELALYAGETDTGMRLSMNTENAISESGNTWFGTFASDDDYVLYKYADGQLINYNVKETALNGSSVTGSSFGNWTITTGKSTAGVVLPASWTSGERPDYAADQMVLTVTNTYSTPYNPPTGTSYILTVQWVDENGTALANPMTRLIASGSSYNADNINGGSGRTFDGYTYNGLGSSSDAISGTMSGSKTVIFTYTETVVIPPENPPLGENPQVESTDETEIPEDVTPLAEAPKTGDELALWIGAAAASGIGLIWLAASRKKRQDENLDG